MRKIQPEKIHAKHQTRQRVIYADVDRAGVVYHANYFRFFEHARVELLRNLGIRYLDVEEKLGVILAIVDCGAEFKAPALYDDEVDILASIDFISASRVNFRYEIRRAGEDRILCSGFTLLASIDAQKRKVIRMPPEILRAVTGSDDGF